jgi:GWxTD domain-containing protein
LDQAINEMIYIASTSQIGYIKNASTNEEKKNRFLEFWKQQDPVSSNSENPYFIEYYNRVAYANEHFSQYFPGWRSDRGMVFILLGPPDNIERYPFEMNSKPYEIWTYYQLNVSLVFVDQTGFGDYRLITPLTGDLNRFRL